MSNQVTIKLDSRVFYLLVALIAVVGIFAIGWWMGTQLNKPAPAPVAQQQPVDQAAGAQAAISDPNVQVQQQLSGAAPVAVEEVPVGDAESRVWIEDLADTNWTYDFGDIANDKVVTKDFTVKNLGKAELVIEQVSASCGCTAALVKDSTVGAGESTVVSVQYDPRVNKEAGKFIKKQVRVKSNDPLVPLAEFTITANVAP